MEEPRTEADLHSVVGDEEEHHEKKPMMTRMRDKMRRMKVSMAKKMHGHVDDHDVHDDDDVHSVESEGYESAATPHGLGGGDEHFTTDRRDKHIDLGTQDSPGGRDDPLPLSSLGEHGPLSSRDDRPVTVASRGQDVPLGIRDELPVSLGDREERPVTPETIKGTAVDADPDDGNISDPKTGNEQSVSSDVLSSFQDMDISPDVEKRPSYTEKLSTTAAGVTEDEEKPSYTEKFPATAAVSAASNVYTKVAGDTHSGETHDQFATPRGSFEPGVEVEPREGAGEEKGSYTEKLPATAVAAKDAAVSVASTVYAKVAGGTHSGEAYDQIATPESTGPGPGVEVEPREGEGAGEEKGSYTENLPTTAVAVKDAAVSAASTVYAKVAGGAHSGETHDQIGTPVSIGPGVEDEPREGEGAGEEKGNYTENLPATAVAATHDQSATPVSTGHGVEVEPREDAEKEKGSYTENLPTTVVAVKDAAVSAASTVYAKVAGGTHSGETHDQIATPVSTEPGVEVEPKEEEGAGEEKGSYTENLPTTVVAVKDAAVSAASTVYAKVAGGTHSGETHDQIATPVSTGPGVEVEPREGEGAGEEKGSYTETLPATAVAVKDAAVSAASTVYAKVAGGTHSGETHDQIATPVSTGPGVEVEPREDSREEKGSYTEKLPATVVAAKDAAVSAASTLYAKVAGDTHSGETHDQIATPVSTGPVVEVEPREDSWEEKGSYTEKLPATAVAAKDAAVSAASTVYAKVAGGTHSGETHDQISTPVSTEPGVEVEPREDAGEKEETYMEQLTGAAWAVYGKMMGSGTAVTGKVQPGGGTDQGKGVSVSEYLSEKLRPGEDDKALCEVISESMKKKGVEESEEGEVKGRIVLPEVTAGEIGVNRVVGTEGSGGPAAAAEGTGGGAAKVRAHE